MYIAGRLWFSSDFEWRNSWILSVSHGKKKKPPVWFYPRHSPSHPQKLKAGESVSIVWGGHESLRWILPPVVLGSALHHGKCLCLTWLYLLIFFCSIKFTVTFIHVYFFFFGNFLWTCRSKACWRTKTKHPSDVNAKLSLLMFGD